MDELKRSGQIPAFGDWEHANELPITQYFESARQAGLIRYSSSGECDQYRRGGDVGLYAANFKKTSHDLGPPRKTRGVRERRVSSSSHVKEQRKQGKVCDVTTGPTRKPISSAALYNASDDRKQNSGVPKFHVRPSLPKPVDEDLYKIPPNLLRSSKRKKMPAFFSCLVPACVS